jgi:hypothetical protein
MLNKMSYIIENRSEMESNLFAKLSKTKLVGVSDEVVRAIPRSLSEAELASVAGGAGGTESDIVFTDAEAGTISVYTVSGGVQDDCG